MNKTPIRQAQDKQHTEIPFTFKLNQDDRLFWLYGKDGKEIAMMARDYDSDRVNARFIVKACNHYEELVDELKKVMLFLECCTTTDFSLGKDKPLRQRISNLLSKLDKEDGE